MANLTTKKEKHIVEMYVRYFGTVATEEQIKSFDGEKSLSKITADIRKDADNFKTGLTPTEFLNDVFQNLFGRDANPKELKYVKTIENNKNLPIATIIKNGSREDKAVYNTKKLVAEMVAAEGGSYELDNITPSNYGSIYNAKKGLSVTTIAELEAKIVNVEGNINGKTFTLTTGVDAGKDFIGTNKNDQFIADNSATVTSSVADTIDGGKGIDTFKVYVKPTADLKAGELPTLKNVENVVIYDNTAAAATDLAKWDTVESVSLVRDKSLVANTYTFGAKTTTVNLVDSATVTKGLAFDAALTSATLGVDNVTATTGITVTGAALKTLTVDASGKASNVILLAPATVETLNITGKGDLTLGATSTLAGVKTVDGSNAEGKLVFSNTLDMTSIKTGSGNDTLTVAAAVASGETINLGAGNDKLVKGAGSVVTSTTTAIDAGAGIDSLDAALVTAGNASVFASFETLSLTTTGANLDLALVNKSTFTTIALDGAATSTVRNVSTSQSLTVNAAAATSTTLLFKDVTGTADAYKINFDATNAAGIIAGTVVVDGIETVTVNSSAKIVAGANKIDLTGSTAKTLVVEGNSDLILTFNTTFGANSAAANDGLGVATIDASALTAGLKIATAELAKIGTAEKGLTIKGGSGDDNIVTGAYTKDLTIETGAGNDTINTTGATGKVIVNAGAGDDTLTVGAAGGTFTLGAGNDKITVTLATAGTTPTTAITEAAAKKTIITDASKGDIIKGLNTALLSKIVLTTEANIDAALATATGTASTNTWFQYAGDTYIVKGDANVGFTEGDTLVKLNGLVDLSTSSLNILTGDLTIA